MALKYSSGVYICDTDPNTIASIKDGGLKNSTVAE